AGIHLSDSKRALVSSRLAMRVRQLRLPNYTTYRNHLKSLPATHPEWQEMINAITTNKTEFFRENHHFEFLRDRLLPQIERQATQNGRRIRIWSAGSSTGESPTPSR
ncbi:MAG TPA: CheR family methyltransferase, partial [Planctomycetaceae bacterium]|nr:CheR family methyltransferase [Planctomycetaceae bacterium]